MAKKLTERFQQFKKLFNAEIVKVYKDSKDLLIKYENKMRRYGVPLQDSQDASEQSSQSSAASKSKVKEEQPRSNSRKASKPRKAAESSKYETNPKVINKQANVKAGSIVLKRKRQASQSSESEYEDQVKSKPGSANLKRRDAILRGETLDKRGPGRPKMTESQKEEARAKRR